MRQMVTWGGGGKAILLYCTNDQCLDDLCGVRMSREPLPDGLLKNHLHCALGQHRAEPKGGQVVRMQGSGHDLRFT